MSLRRRHRQQTRDAVFDAARALLDEQGVEGLTFRAIADRAGVSVGTVANHAGTKAELVVGLLVDDLGAAIAAHAAPPATDDVIADLTERFRGFFTLYARRPRLARRTVVEAAFAPPEAYAPYLALTLGFVDDLARWLDARGALRSNVPADVAARIVFDAYIGVVILYLREAAPQVDRGLAGLRATLERLRPVLFA